MHFNGCCDFYSLAQSRMKRKVELPVVVDTRITSESHETNPSTVVGLNRYRSVGEEKVDPITDHREIPGREALSIPGGPVRAVPLVVSHQPPQSTEDVVQRVPNSSGSSATLPASGINQPPTRSHSDTLTEEEEGRRQVLEALWSLLKDAGYESC